MTRPARAREADAGGATRLMVDPNFVIVTLMGGPVRPALAPKGEFLGARANSLSSTHWRYAGDPVLAFLSGFPLPSLFGEPPGSAPDAPQ